MDYFKVASLEKYQHYKNRNPPWVRLYTHILEDHEFTKLPDETKWLAIGLVLLASRCSNRIAADPRWLKNRLSCSKTPDLKPLIRIGFLEMLATCKQDASNLLDLAEQSRGEQSRDTCSSTSDERVAVSGNGKRNGRAVWAKVFDSHFWPAFPRKVGKQAAMKAWMAQMPKRREVFRERCTAILDLLDRRVDGEWDSRPRDKIPYPATFLRSEGFEEQE